jgi:hypothetical protein
MKNLRYVLPMAAIMTMTATSYDVSNIRLANTLTCFYTENYRNGVRNIIPEFDRTPSTMRVYNNGRTIYAPKGTRYDYRSVDEKGIMRYVSANGKYEIFLFPTTRGVSVGGQYHYYKDIIVAKIDKTYAAVGNCLMTHN